MSWPAFELASEHEILLVIELSFVSRSGIRVGPPEDQAKLPDVVSVMAAVEADDFHSEWDLDPGPDGFGVAAPLALVDTVAVVVEEADAVDVAFVLAKADIDCRDALERRDADDVGVQPSTVQGIEGGTLDVVREGKLELVQIRRGFEAETTQLDFLAQV